MNKVCALCIGVSVGIGVYILMLSPYERYKMCKEVRQCCKEIKQA